MTNIRKKEFCFYFLFRFYLNIVCEAIVEPSDLQSNSCMGSFWFVLWDSHKGSFDSM